jgi:hypothetical protein
MLQWQTGLLRLFHHSTCLLLAHLAMKRMLSLHLSLRVVIRSAITQDTLARPACQILEQ